MKIKKAFAPPRDNETHSECVARATADPLIQSGVTTASIFNMESDENFDSAMIEELENHREAISNNDFELAERMLVAQAHTLSQLFYDLVYRTIANNNAQGLVQTSEIYMRLALKAQTQCRASLQTLSDIKNPKPLTFVRQANIANNQQVNNHDDEPASQIPRAGDFKIVPNKLNTGQLSYEQSLDAAIASQTSRSDSKLEALASVDRATNGHREGPVKSKRLEGRRTPSATRVHSQPQ